MTSTPREKLIDVTNVIAWSWAQAMRVRALGQLLKSVALLVVLIVLAVRARTIREHGQNMGNSPHCSKCRECSACRGAAQLPKLDIVVQASAKLEVCGTDVRSGALSEISTVPFDAKRCLALDAARPGVISNASVPGWRLKGLASAVSNVIGHFVGRVRMIAIVVLAVCLALIWGYLAGRIPARLRARSQRRRPDGPVAYTVSDLPHGVFYQRLTGSEEARAEAKLKAEQTARWTCGECAVLPDFERRLCVGQAAI